MYNDFEFPFENLIEDQSVAEQLKEAIVNAVKRCLNGKKECGLLFSGGLDSTIIAKILLDLGINFTAYTVGVKKSADIEAAKSAALKLKIKIKPIVIEKEKVEDIARGVIWITKSTDPVTVGVSIPIYLAVKEAALDGYSLIFSGTGSDEVFAGYNSHLKALQKGWEAVHKECANRLYQIDKDVKRDISICAHFGIEPRMPFLDIDVVRLGMAIHPKLKISSEQNKIILRKVAQKIGIPKEIYERKKKAAQYGSGVNKVLKENAQKAKFGNLQDYLKSLKAQQKI